MSGQVPGGVELGEVVDLDRYPIDAPGSSGYVESVRVARWGLEERECAHIANFVRPGAVERMRLEAEQLATVAVYFSQEHNPYFSDVVDEVRPRDPRAIMGRKTNGLVPGEAFPRDGVIWNLYRHPAVKDFVQDCLGGGPLYFYDDPYGCLNVSMQRDTEEFAWHFDTNEFTVSVLLQRPARGGVFEFAPNIRTAGSESFPDVAAVLDGDRSRVTALDLQPGDPQLFKGRYSVHRVTPVEGPTPRLIALLAYSRAPGMYALPVRSQQIWGRVHPDQVQAAKDSQRADALTD